MRPLDLPRIGRYRLYDLGPNNRVRCRLCARWFKRDNARRHALTESGHWGGDWPTASGRSAMEEYLILILAKRRSHRNLLAARRAKMDDPEWHERDRERIKMMDDLLTLRCPRCGAVVQSRPRADTRSIRRRIRQTMGSHIRLCHAGMTDRERSLELDRVCEGFGV